MESRHNTTFDDDDVDAAESKVLHALVSHYPTPLNAATANETVPWQQAAVGHGASLTTIYGLLRRQPTLMPVVAGVKRGRWWVECLAHDNFCKISK
jgi:hypothetical protein